jgi:hypothetical protein
MSGNEIVLPGFKIELELVDRSGERERLTVQIVPDAYADLARGYLGEGTPLCQAIFGQTAGAEILYEIGDLCAVKILTVRPTDEAPDRSIAAKREDTLKKAVEKSNLTDAVIFASSFNGKWGDYDPSGLLDELDKDERVEDL